MYVFCSRDPADSVAAPLLRATWEGEGAIPSYHPSIRHTGTEEGLPPTSLTPPHWSCGGDMHNPSRRHMNKTLPLRPIHCHMATKSTLTGKRPGANHNAVAAALEHWRQTLHRLQQAKGFHLRPKSSWHTTSSNSETAMLLPVSASSDRTCIFVLWCASSIISRGGCLVSWYITTGVQPRPVTDSHFVRTEPRQQRI